MGKVFFVCLMTLAVALHISKADEIPKPPIAADDKLVLNVTSTDLLSNITKVPNTTLSTLSVDNGAVKTVNISTPVLTNNTVSATESNIDESTASVKNINVTTVTDKAEVTTIVNTIVNNVTKAEDKENSTKVTTMLPAKTTEPITAGTSKTVVTQSSFHGPSFIGGIVLTLGLLAIGFMGLKYYRAQTERNYHTL